MDSKLICYLCCICLLWSCEYKIHENFVDIEKPQDSANASIDLNAVTDGQTILINKETELNYSLTAFGKDIKGLKFKMGDIVWSDSDLQFHDDADDSCVCAGALLENSVLPSVIS